MSILKKNTIQTFKIGKKYVHIHLRHGDSIGLYRDVWIAAIA